MSEQAESFTGGCRCGKVTYTCDSAPMFAAHCHCRDCQYASGGGFSTIVGVATAKLTLNGDLAGFTVTAESGNQLTRKFCPTCGTPMLTQLHSNEQMTVLKAGTMDDPSLIKPGMHIWTSSGQPWTEELGVLPKFDKNPG